jgi:hypothetical protein
MSTITEITTTAQEQLLDTIKFGQDAIVDGLKTLSEAVDGLVPSAALPGLDALPFASALPNAKETVTAAFSFAQKLLANQCEFAGSVLETVGTMAANSVPGPSADA